MADLVAVHTGATGRGPPTTVPVPVSEKAVAAQWKTWQSHQRPTGTKAVPDFADPEQMNRFTRCETHNWTQSYPGDSKTYAPDDVPGAYIPSAENDG